LEKLAAGGRAEGGGAKGEDGASQNISLSKMIVGCKWIFYSSNMLCDWDNFMVAA
jgi:hypothetical protein